VFPAEPEEKQKESGQRDAQRELTSKREFKRE